MVGALAALAAVGFTAVMAAVYRAAGWPAQAAPLGRTTALLGRQIFTAYAIPFEVASVVLLAALVGAIYLSTRFTPSAPRQHEGGAREEKGGASCGGTP